MSETKTTTLREAAQLFHQCGNCHRITTMTDQVQLREYLYDPDEYLYDPDPIPEQFQNYRMLIAAVLRCPACQHHLCTLLIEP